MIGHQKERQLTQLQIEQNDQQHDNDVFESVSGQSATEQQQHTQTLIQTNQHFTLIPLEFPPPDKHTLHLIELYEQNANLIQQLKQQISRLSQIKRGNLFIKYDSVKMSFQQQQSECFLSSQSLYKQRQEELEKLKREIRGVDREQLTTIMSKNQHIFNLAEAYFERFRTVVDGDIYGEELVVLTEEKRKMHRKKKHNNGEEKNTHYIGQQRIMRNQSSQRSDNDSNSNSKLSTSRRHLQKPRRLFNLRFLHLSHLFPQFSSSQTPTITTCFTLGEKTQSVPRSFVMDQRKRFILVLFSTNVIKGYCFDEGSQEEIRDDHESNQHGHADKNFRLKEITEFKIEIDLNCQVIFFSLRNQQLYLLTTDAVLRVYHLTYNPSTHHLSSYIPTILYCLNSDQTLGEIQHVALNKLNKDEILFTTSMDKLCKVSLGKYKAEIVRKYHEKVGYMNGDYVELDERICVGYYKQSDRHYIAKEEIGELFIKDGQSLLKTCTLMQGNQIHFVRIGKHGLLTGYSKDLQQ